MDSWLVFRSYRVTLNQWTKWNNRSFKWFPKTSLMERLPFRKEILNISQIGVTFHGICPPIFIQTWLQQYCRGAFLYSVSAIPFVSDLCVVSMYSDSKRDLHKLCQIRRNCQCKSYSAPRTFASFSVFPVKFLFCTGTTGSIEWPSPAPRLIVPRFTICTENFVICCYQITNFFSTRHGFHHCVFCMGPL